MHGPEERVPLAAVRATLAADYLQLVDPDRVSNPHGWGGLGWLRRGVLPRRTLPRPAVHAVSGWRQHRPSWPTRASKLERGLSRLRSSLSGPSAGVTHQNHHNQDLYKNLSSLRCLQGACTGGVPTVGPSGSSGDGASGGSSRSDGRERGPNSRSRVGRVGRGAVCRECPFCGVRV